MSNTMFPMTAAPRSLEARSHTCLPLGAGVRTGVPAVLGTSVNSIVNAAVDMRVATARADVPAYGFKQGRPPRGVPR